MRLIDADSFEVISYKAVGDEEYRTGFDDGATFILERIDNAPSVEAIPVEWLKAKMRGYLIEAAGECFEYEYASICNKLYYSISNVLGLWRQGQEVI